jgi:Cu-Zn family superoxide dismutase
MKHPVLPCLIAVLVVACAAPSMPGPATPNAAAAPVAVAVLAPTRGNTAAGTVYFSQDGSQVRLSGRITGLVANQEHGFHVHEKGDCSSGDGMSAGGHLNPNAKPHGPPGAEHHAGDLPSVKADASGAAEVRGSVVGTVVGSGAADLAGKALIVHVAPDDYTSQPAGNSGARIACGLIAPAAGRDPAGNPTTVPKNM